MDQDKSWIEWKNEGCDHMRNQKWDEAVSCFMNAIRIKSDEAVLYSLRATCELKVKDYGRAREDALSAIRLNPKNIKFHCVLTEALIGLKLFRQALKACDEGLEVDAREPHLIIRRKDCMEKLSGRNSHDSYDELLEIGAESVFSEIENEEEASERPIQIDVFELMPMFNFVSQLSVAANQQFESQMVQRSMAGSLTAKMFCEASAKAAQARLLLGQNLFDEAFQTLREAWRMWDRSICDDGPFISSALQVLEREPNNHQALSIAVYSGDMEPEERLRMAELAADLDPQNADYFCTLSRMYLLCDEYEMALGCCDKAIELSAHPTYLSIRAKILNLLEDTEPNQLIEAYEKFLSHAPTDYPHVAEAYYGMGYQYFLLEQPHRAAALYRRALEAEDASVRLHCFTSLDDFWPKICLQEYLREADLWPMEARDSVGVDMCSTCAKTNPPNCTILL